MPAFGKGTTTALILLLTLLLTACTADGQSQPSEQPAVTVAAAPAQAPAQAPQPGPYEQAQAELKAGRYAEAVALLRQVTAAEPSRFDAWNDLAYAYIHLENWSLAAEAGRKAQTLKPNDPAANFNTGRAYLGLKNYYYAALYLQAAHEKNGGNLDVLWYLGQAREGQKDLRLALQTYQDGLAMAPEDADFQAAVQRLQTGLDAASPLILQADLTLDGQADQVRARPGQLLVLDAGGKELLRLDQRWVSRYQVKTFDLAGGPPVLWVQATAACNPGLEHSLYRFSPAEGTMERLFTFGCAAEAKPDAVNGTITFVTRWNPYQSFTYRVDASGGALVGQPDALFASDIEMAVNVAMHDGLNGGQVFFTDPNLARNFLTAWADKTTVVRFVSATFSADKKNLTANITIQRSQPYKSASGWLTAIETKDGWKISAITLK